MVDVELSFILARSFQDSADPALRVGECPLFSWVRAGVVLDSWERSGVGQHLELLMVCVQ